MTAAQKKAFVARMAAARAARAGRSSGSKRPTTEIIVAPSTSLGAPPRHSPPKSTSLARRVGSAAVVAAVQEKQLLATAITGAGIGYVEAEGWLQELPEPESLPIGKVGVLAVASYAVNRFLVKDPETKKILSGVTNAAVAISSYQMGKGYALKKQAEALAKGVDGDLENEDKAGV